MRAELLLDRQALARHRQEATEALGRWSSGPERAYLVYGAAAVHAWYTGVEASIERVARTLDLTVPRGESWHRELLSQAGAEVPGVRPPIIPREHRADLLSLLAFRHFFRHGYGAELDPVRVRAELERLLRLSPAVEGALDEFDRFLASAQAALGP